MCWALVWAIDKEKYSMCIIGAHNKQEVDCFLHWSIFKKFLYVKGISRTKVVFLYLALHQSFGLWDLHIIELAAVCREYIAGKLMTGSLIKLSSTPAWTARWTRGIQWIIRLIEIYTLELINWINKLTWKWSFERYQTYWNSVEYQFFPHKLCFEILFIPCSNWSLA